MGPVPPLDLNVLCRLYGIEIRSPEEASLRRTIVGLLEQHPLPQKIITAEQNLRIIDETYLPLLKIVHKDIFSHYRADLIKEKYSLDQVIRASINAVRRFVRAREIKKSANELNLPETTADTSSNLSTTVTANAERSSTTTQDEAPANQPSNRPKKRAKTRAKASKEQKGCAKGQFDVAEASAAPTSSPASGSGSSPTKLSDGSHAGQQKRRATPPLTSNNGKQNQRAISISSDDSVIKIEPGVDFPLARSQVYHDESVQATQVKAIPSLVLSDATTPVPTRSSRVFHSSSQAKPTPRHIQARTFASLPQSLNRTSKPLPLAKTTESHEESDTTAARLRSLGYKITTGSETPTEQNTNRHNPPKQIDDRKECGEKFPTPSWPRNRNTSTTSTQSLMTARDRSRNANSIRLTAMRGQRSSILAFRPEKSSGVADSSSSQPNFAQNITLHSHQRQSSRSEAYIKSEEESASETPRDTTLPWMHRRSVSSLQTSFKCEPPEDDTALHLKESNGFTNKTNSKSSNVTNAWRSDAGQDFDQMRKRDRGYYDYEDARPPYSHETDHYSPASRGQDYKRGRFDMTTDYGARGSRYDGYGLNPPHRQKQELPRTRAFGEETRGGRGVSPIPYPTYNGYQSHRTEIPRGINGHARDDGQGSFPSRRAEERFIEGGMGMIHQDHRKNLET